MFFFRRRRKDERRQAEAVPPKDAPSNPELVVEGRRYRSDVPYLLPKDIQEVNRLDFQHYLLRQLLKGNYVAPVGTPGTILDVACGTGRWLIELGQEFPQAKLTGIDLEVPVVASKLDSRFSFRVVNIIDGLPYADNSFDFVHQRFLVTALPAQIWPKLVQDLIRVTASGGWLEVIDVTHLLVPYGPAGQQMMEWIEQMCTLRSIDPLLPQQLGALLKSSPLLEEVQSVHVDIPVGDWGGRSGSLLAKDYYTVYESVKPLYVKHLKIDPNEYDRLLSDMRQEWETHQSKSRVYFAYGRKKESQEG